MTTTSPTGRTAGGEPRRRETKQRAAVSAMLDRVDTFMSAQQLHARLRDEGDSIGLATVYRSIQQLVEDGEVDVVHPGDGEAVYRRCSSGHHHHLVCRICRTTVEVDSRAVELWAQRIAADNRFADVDHVIEVFGTCSACAGRISR
jgi:Fur family transcriptional regulator, ferric uptake regulator